MAQGTLDTYQYEPQARYVPKCQSSKLVAVGAKTCVALAILFAATLAILALLSCFILREDQQALVQEMEALSRRFQSLQNLNNVSNSIGSKDVPSAVTNAKHVEQLTQVLTQVVTAAKKISARVPEPKVWPDVHASQNLTCESGGNEPLSYCLWGRTVNGQYEVILIDEEVVQNGGRTAVDGISYAGNGLDDGQCGIKIESVTLQDFGPWSCTLVAETGEVFTGIVNIKATQSILTVPDVGPAIYFVNFYGAIKAYSPGKSEAYMVIHESNEDFYGIAYDPLADKLYWSADFVNRTWSICRSNRNGTGLERVVYTSEYQLTFELAFDWITGNVYGVTLNGLIFVCDPRRTGTSSSCATVLKDQGKVEGIALNPVAGLMYFSSGDSILRAEMDGSNRAANFISVNAPRGIFIDLEDSRLYWSSTKDKLIQSSNLEGGDIRTIVYLTEKSHPQGIAVMGDRIYWTDHYVGKLESSKKDGTDVQTSYNGAHTVMHLVAAPTDNKHLNRTNRCDQQCNSTVICVLNANSFRCLDRPAESGVPAFGAYLIEPNDHDYPDYTAEE